jgi:beta-lactam-binding protein with PASTA domain
MATSDTLIDTLFDGRYRIVRRLGSGGMANVYLAEDQELGRRVAIKILNDRHAADEQFVERFRREAKNAASLSHPNIVSIYDRGEAEGTYYIAMEYLDGRTLKELIVRNGPAPIRRAIAYAREVLSALRVAHRQGIVHRDIKPHNVLVDSEGRLKVTDFGIARAGASQMTEVGSIIGTAQYLSPEQARGSTVDHRSDIYSLGIVLYELLTGVAPFSGDTPLEIAMKHLSAVPEPPSAKRAEIPEDLDMIVLRALAKDPESRYQSAQEMDADLARVERGLGVTDETAEAATQVLAGAGIEAPTRITRAPVQPPAYAQTYYEYDGAPPPERERPFWPWLLLLAFLVAAGVAGVYAYQQIEDELAEATPVAVPNVEGIIERLAVDKVRNADLNPRVRRLHDEEVELGRVYDQAPEAGERIDRGNTVVVFVSLGKPKVKVPSVRGKRLADATSALADVGLKWRVVEVNSDQAVGTVVAQDPRPGSSVVKGSAVRLNISKGPRTAALPDVIGQSFERAAAQLRGAGFSVARTNVDSDEPKGRVVAQDPGGNTVQPIGSTVTLSVSRGPQEPQPPDAVPVPDVLGVDEQIARDTLEGAGFSVRVEREDVSVPDQEGIVLSQDPPADTEAKPGSVVTIIVGRLV